MAKRVRELDEKLEGRPKGWQDVIGGGQQGEQEARPAEKPQRAFMNKTYILRPETVERIAALARQERLQVNELARFLLEHALEEVESGRLKIPTAVDSKRILS